AKPKKKAVLVTSSAAPRFIARWLMVPIKTLKELASMLGAKPIGTLWIGMVDPKDSKLSTRNHQRAQQLGHQLTT
ncbi:MAG: flavodoxin family protein, partial [Xenococcus sp. (in: cyanobacteria)]